jgi:hypothetical protein
MSALSPRSASKLSGLVSGAGHMLPFERPDPVIEALEGLLGQARS